jgi:hypothetical protein
LCGCEAHAERRFGGLVVPSEVTVGWWFRTPEYSPFFRARIEDLEGDGDGTLRADYGFERPRAVPRIAVGPHVPPERSRP